MTAYYNLGNWVLDVDSELVHPVSVSTRALFQLEGVGQQQPINYRDAEYTDNQEVRRKFMRWIKRGKYPYVIAAFYTLKTPSGRELHKVAPVAAFDYEHYLKMQHALLHAYMQYKVTGGLPLI